MSASEFEGRTALVTGGSRGIGRAICCGLAAGGARIAVNYTSDESAARETRDECRERGVEAEIYKADVSDPRAVAEMLRSIEIDIGPIDMLVANAGLSRANRSPDVTLEDWRRVLAVNLDGTFLPVMGVKDGMLARGFGRIVCISSVAGLRPRPSLIAYSTAKAAVIGFVRSVAAAFGPDVRVNCVAPGLIDTDMIADMDAARRQSMADEAALGRIGQPRDIAEVVLFLLSERSAFTTGQTLVADGGRIMLP